MRLIRDACKRQGFEDAAGPSNAITDVAGAKVGYATVIQDSPRVAPGDRDLDSADGGGAID